MQKSGANNWARRGGLIALTISTMIAAGCGGGDSPASPTSSPSGGVTPVPAPAPGTNTPPTISATPVEQVSVGSTYVLTPVAQDADGDTLAFSVENKPTWAAFNTATGRLSGAPAAADVGAFDNVVISVSDGKTGVSLPAFSILVAQAGDAGGVPVPVSGNAVALTWDVPTVTVDGETLSDLSGYRIHYGVAADVLTGAIEIPSAGLNQYVVQGLEKGTYYFAVRAVTETGVQSAPSNIITRIIG